MRSAKLLRPNVRNKLSERVELFIHDSNHAQLRNHELKGKWIGYRSIDITGDIRALYLVRDDEVIFDAIGTHSQLYG